METFNIKILWEIGTASCGTEGVNDGSIKHCEEELHSLRVPHGEETPLLVFTCPCYSEVYKTSICI